jgi:hypothetical protein
MTNKDGMYPEIAKVERSKRFTQTGIKEFVSDGYTRCKRCGNDITKGETHMWVRNQGSFHIGKCPTNEGN